MPKQRKRKSQRKPQTLFSRPDDERIKKAYNICVNEYGSNPSWGAVTNQYIALINQELTKTIIPSERIRLKLQKQKATNRRIRERYTNHLQPGVRSIANLNPGSPDVAMVIQCINALEEDEYTDLKKSHRFSQINREWRRRSPDDFLSINGLKSLIIRLEKKRMIVADYNGRYHQVNPAAAVASVPTPSVAIEAPHRPNNMKVTAHDRTVPTDFRLNIKEVELNRVKVRLNEKKAELNAKDAELNAKEAELNAKQVQQKAILAAFEALRKDLEEQSRAMASEETALKEQADQLQQKEASLTTKLEAEAQRLRQIKAELSSRKQVLLSAESRLAAQEAWFTEWRKSRDTSLDTDRNNTDGKRCRL